MDYLCEKVRQGVCMSSSYETKENIGSTHFLELNAFRTTHRRAHKDVRN